MSRLKPAEGWSSLVLLTLMLLTVAWSIEAANWAEGLGLLQGIVLGAILIGLIVTRYWVPGVVAHLFSATLGLGWSLYLTSRLLDPGSIHHQVILDEESLTLRVRLTELVYRFQDWVATARGGGVAEDNLMFILQMAVLIWLVSYATIWFLFRVRNVWGAIVPSGFAMLLNLYYASPDLYTWMALYLLCALLLIVRTNVFLQEQEWREARIGYAPDIGFDFLRDGAIFALIVILVAWVVPTTNAAPRLYAFVDRFNEPVYRFQRQFNRLFSSLNYESQPGPAYFGDSLTLSGPVNLGDAPIFDAVTDKGRYWRGVVYDQYTGHGWVNTATALTTLHDNDPRLDALKFELREPVTQTVRVLQPGMTQLHALAQPIRVNVPARVQYSPVPETTDEGVMPLNISMMYSRRPLQAGDTYTVVSSLSAADVQSLRNAGTDYPEWIVDQYLQLPDDLPQRVRDLAVELTAEYDNPYDQVAAIERYLRRIKYDEKIPAPPPGVDAVDWFLFNERAGYCDYYASALAVMARAIGIPARVAAGYSRGDYDPDVGAYRQREYDAHSWPEVFFPRYGWVEFEPTAADPLIVRPSRPATEGDNNSATNPGGERPDRLPPEELMDEGGLGSLGPLPTLSQQRFRPWTWFGLISTGLLLLSMVALWVAWQRGLRGLTFAEATYARMARMAHWLGVIEHPHQTPNEYADHLGRAVPDGRPAIGQITDAYVRERFGDRPPGAEESSTLHQAWQDLRRLLLEGIGVRILQRITAQEAEETKPGES